MSVASSGIESPEEELDDELDGELEDDEEEGASGSPGKGNLAAVEGAPPPGVPGFALSIGAFAGPELSPGKGNCSAIEGLAAGTLTAGGAVQGSFLV